ncbi:MAG: alpha-L-fucosidase, partial [Opitutales bacterium]|nr:alpha-L-fucosidase [Opitutales bacterium]
MTRIPQSKPILIGLLAALLTLLGIRDVRCSADDNAEAWLDLKAGMFIHFNMSTFTGKSWSTGEEDPSLFNPTDLDVGSWAKAAKTGGLKYGVLTVKHHDGFALWNTKLNDHDVASSPYRKDIVKEFADAFRASKLKVGLYYSIWDRRWDRDPSIDQVETIKAQLMELLGGKYGQIDLLWLDGWGWQKKYSDIPYDEIRGYIREISPGTVVSNNDHENSLDTTDLLIWETAVKMPVPVASTGPFEVAEQIGRTWFFREGKESENKPREYFQWLVTKVVPEGGIVTFNVGPDKTGAIPKERTSALKQINEALKRGPIRNWAVGATVSQS